MLIFAMDSIDRRLLSLLQDDASMPLQDIAARVGLSVNPCWRRIKRMESEGIIRARVAVLDPEKVGLHVTVFVRIKVREHTSDWVKRFAAAVRSIAEIAECHRKNRTVLLGMGAHVRARRRERPVLDGTNQIHHQD